MDLVPLSIKGAWVATSPVHVDHRGNFREWFKRADILVTTGINFCAEQANVSVSKLGVIRGIHYSLDPKGQAKWISCISGAIIDVVVDIRPSSPTFLRVEYIDLKGGDGKAVLIAKGLGHGFISLEEKTVVSYLLSSPFAPEFEKEINPADPTLNIDWHLALINGVDPVISLKDARAPSLRDRENTNQLPD